MEYVGHDEEYQLPKTAQEVYEEQEPFLFPDVSAISQSSEESAYQTKEYIVQLIYDEYGEKGVKQYESIYNKHLYSDHLYNGLSVQLEQITDKRLDNIQSLLDLRIDLCEAEGTYEVRQNEELTAAIRKDVENGLIKQYNDIAAQEAYMEFQNYHKNLEGGESRLPEFEEVVKQKNTKETEEQKEQMIKRFEAMLKANELEYVVRGAPIMCMVGSHSRHLDMYRSHGIYINDKAVAFEDDCVVDKNISYFGHCNSPTCTLTELISLKVGQVVNTAGVALHNAEGSVHEGIKCVPEFDGKWKNTHLTTLIAKDGGAEIFGDGYSPYGRALTTASYLICKHGGLVYPLTSGQIDEAYYHAAFQKYPFHDFGSEAFYKWCDENEVCPVIAGKPGHIRWHQEKINDALADFKQAKKNYDDKYPKDRVENNLYSSPSDTLNTTNEYKEYSDYEAARNTGQTVYENCLLEAKRVGAANMSGEEAAKYGEILQDYLNSGLLLEYEKQEVVSRYGDFLEAIGEPEDK